VRSPEAERAPRKLEKILLSQGKITAEQLEEALLLQQEDRRGIGQLLISLGYISKVDLAQSLAHKLGIRYAELGEESVDPGALGLVDRRVLRKHGAIPLRIVHGRLLVAMSDPTNLYALEDLRMISGYPITPVVAVDDEILRALDDVFTEEVADLLAETGGELVAEPNGEVELEGDVRVGSAPIVRFVGSILRRAIGDGASDIHVEPRARELGVRMRVDGLLRQTTSVSQKLQSGIVARLKILADLDIAEKRLPQDGRFSVRLGDQKVDLRVATLPTVFGEKVVLRLLDTANVEVNLRGLGFAPEVLRRYEEVFHRPYGTILVTGPTGSGKSTTLYATLKELNTPQKNIITVEDPVEYRMAGINQIQVNPKISLTFASGLRSILRSDPDIVMIGEIRDRETAKISVEAALTGHLVLATPQECK
jgi:type IV pilus assembly protein PilB